MSASLVGSEMCIRDRCGPSKLAREPPGTAQEAIQDPQSSRPLFIARFGICLLYTSDAADDM
eukprot:9323377-Alexandrium_andersonii.AAC.1